MARSTPRPARLPSTCREVELTSLLLSQKRRAAHRMGRTSFSIGPAFLLTDSLEGAVLLDLVDPESGRQLHLAVLLERNPEPEDRGLQVRLRDLLPYRLPGRRAVTGLAGPGDGPNDNLRRHVRRQSEELAVATVRLHVGLDDFIRRVVRERRVVRAGDLPHARSEQAVRSEQLDVALAGCL